MPILWFLKSFPNTYICGLNKALCHILLSIVGPKTLMTVDGNQSTYPTITKFTPRFKIAPVTLVSKDYGRDLLTSRQGHPIPLAVSKVLNNQLEDSIPNPVVVLIKLLQGERQWMDISLHGNTLQTNPKFGTTIVTIVVKTNHDKLMHKLLGANANQHPCLEACMQEIKRYAISHSSVVFNRSWWHLARTMAKCWLKW